jgi:hypothetical protein
MRRLVLSCAAAAALMTAMPAAAQPASPDHCLLTRLLQGHTVAGDGHTLYFGANGTDVYQVTTGGPCLAHATASDTIVLRDRGLGKICHPNDLDLTVRGTRCVVDKFVKLSPSEISALPKRLQP